MTDENNSEQEERSQVIEFNPLRFHWEVGDMVAASAMPGRYSSIEDDFKILKEEGIEVIVNLAHRTFRVPPEFEGSFKVFHEPVVDGQAPDEQQLEKIIGLVQEAVSRGKRTVIHCRGGIGRTATVLIPLIMELENLSLEDAMTRVRESGRYPQSREQREFLESWAQNFKYIKKGTR